MRHSKQRIRQLTAELRDLWCEWDPIGVMQFDDWPRDEYDSYLGRTLGLLQRGGSRQELEKYLSIVELESMGLSESPRRKLARQNFAARLVEWYVSKKPGPSQGVV
jgi:hypothetical protein